NRLLPLGDLQSVYLLMYPDFSHLNFLPVPIYRRLLDLGLIPHDFVDYILQVTRKLIIKKSIVYTYWHTYKCDYSCCYFVYHMSNYTIENKNKILIARKKCKLKNFPNKKAIFYAVQQRMAFVLKYKVIS